MSPVEQLLRDLVGLFERLETPYAIIGGIAVRAHGLPRPTYDVDVTLSMERKALPSLFNEIEALGYDVGEQYHGGWVDQVAGMPLVKASTFIDGRTLNADIFLAENEFQKVLLTRRVQEAVDGLDMWIASPEDLILLKLIADRPRDRADIQDILIMQPGIDKSYLNEWAKKMGTSKTLQQAYDEFNQ